MKNEAKETHEEILQAFQTLRRLLSNTNLGATIACIEYNWKSGDSIYLQNAIQYLKNEVLDS